MKNRIRKRDRLREKRDRLWIKLEEQKAESKAIQGIGVIIIFILLYFLK